MSASPSDTCIIIPSFNAGASLIAAVESAASLDLVSRIIVVDDGSNPPINGHELEEAARQHAVHFELIRQSNAGPSAARNRGLDAMLACDLPWAIFLDADDLLEPAIEHSIALAERLNAGAVVSGRIDVYDDGSSRTRPAPSEWSGRLLPRKGDVFRPIGLFGTPGLAVSRRVLESGVRFDESLKHGEDREFLRRVADVAPIAVSGGIGVRYRLHGSGATNLNSAAHFARRAQDFAAITRRYLDAETNAHFMAGGRWLINSMAKHGAAHRAWDIMTTLFDECGWRIPLKARLRRILRGSRPA